MTTAPRTTSQVDDADRVLPTTRWTAGVVAVVLVVAGVILYVFPSRTGRLWAWEMAPPLTALVVGGGYLAGATFFARAFRSTRWHELGVTFLAATVLSGLLLVATVLHWESFAHEHPSFWAWAVLYVAAPLWLPVLWFRNRRHDPGDAVNTPLVPLRIRRLVGGLGALQALFALAIFVHPPLAMAWWPWTLSPLTARTVGSFCAFVAVVWLAFWWEPRWSALRLHVESAVLGLVLVALGAVRAAEDLTGSPAAAAFIFGLLALTVVGAVALLTFMQRLVAGREVAFPQRDASR